MFLLCFVLFCVYTTTRNLDVGGCWLWFKHLAVKKPCELVLLLDLAVLSVSDFLSDDCHPTS